jgi:anti-sigma factor RsiW
MPDCTEYRVLMMGLMDNELTPEETADVNQHLIRCEACRREYDELSRSYSKLEAVSFSGPSDDELDRVWKSPFSRFTRNAGLFIGFIILLYAVLSDRLRAFKIDPYKEVKR